ncbi:unnamed protein product, partial [Gadus morhua 'NCC']
MEDSYSLYIKRVQTQSALKHIPGSAFIPGPPDVSPGGIRLSSNSGDFPAVLITAGYIITGSPSIFYLGTSQGLNKQYLQASPTVPPLRSEHFKPCHERDLTYCLNSGECFVIETLSGPHKHC